MIRVKPIIKEYCQEEEVARLPSEQSQNIVPKLQFEQSPQGIRYLKQSFAPSPDTSHNFQDSTKCKTTSGASFTSPITQKFRASSVPKRMGYQGGTTHRASVVISSFSNLVEPEKTIPPNYDEKKLYFQDPEIRKLAESSYKYRNLTWRDNDKQLGYFYALKESGLLNNRLYGDPEEVLNLRLSRITGTPIQSNRTSPRDLDMNSLMLDDVKRELLVTNYKTRIRSVSRHNSNYQSHTTTPMQTQRDTRYHHRNNSDFRYQDPISVQKIKSLMNSKNGSFVQSTEFTHLKNSGTAQPS